MPLPRALRPLLLMVALATFLSVILPSSFGEGPAGDDPAAGSVRRFPGVDASHRHQRLLLENALGYINPAHGILDPASGYPAEGWNQQPGRGLFLRSFTQLTAIGAWIELLANIAAGNADNPYLSRASALGALSLVVASLREDQRNPALSAKGLLVNFMGLEGGRRTAPLQETVQRGSLLEAFGPREGQAIWQALVAKDWLLEEDNGLRGRIRRGKGYGIDQFDGSLAPFADEPQRSRILSLLDRRVRTIIFGDNANLTAALARAVGALLHPEIRQEPQAALLRESMEGFIKGQREGYAHLYDPKSGTFFFGWDATTDRFVGWDDGQGGWVTGQMNYFINEFRGPWTFVVLRYGLPPAALRNAGFKVRPYRHTDGRDRYALAAWDGSAFQLLGLSLFMQEQRNPGWMRSLQTLVEVELDYSDRHGLPGLLSEAYSGRGTQYTGLIGIPELAATDNTLITDAPSLYTLGVAYSIAPARVEGFLKGHWPRISALFSPHGPWEGWNTSAPRVIPYQTTAHTLSLILGGLNKSQENMRRYLAEHGLEAPLADLYAPGDPLDLLAEDAEVIPWTSDERPPEFAREPGLVRFAAELGGAGGLAFRLPAVGGVSLSNGRLVIGFRSATGVPDALIAFKRSADDPLPPPAIPVEVLLRLPQTEEGQIEVVLPATLALRGIQEVSLVIRGTGGPQSVDLSLLNFAFVPFDAALDAPPPDGPVQ